LPSRFPAGQASKGDGPGAATRTRLGSWAAILRGPRGAA